jgi:hypothetical protein
MKNHLLITLCIFISFSVKAAGPVSVCSEKPDFLSQQRVSLSLKNLPRVVLVGTSAEYYVETKSTGLKLWGRQSFKSGKSEIVCGQMGQSQNSSFSLYGPTLLDLSGEKNVGDSYWQFHMIANTKNFGIWNKKTWLFPKTKDLEKGIEKTGAQMQVYQISHDEFEMVLTRDSDQAVETLSIRFDAIQNLQ